MRSVGVLGAGSFGTALAAHAAATDRDVVLWARREDLAATMAAESVNPEYLPGVRLPPRLRATADLSDLVECELVIVAVPSHGFRQAVRDFLAVHPGHAPVRLISATKGIEVESQARMSQVAFEEGIAADRDVHFAVLSGPSFATELAQGMVTAVVIAADEPELAGLVQSELSSRVLRLYSSGDVVGVELGGAVKNVIAIAAGVVTGLGLGHNTLAALVTRGLHEITRLGIAYGGQPRTFAGLAGLGDLLLTCTGTLSRNRRAGTLLAQGQSVGEITGGTSMVAEGINSSLAVVGLAARRNVEMPITEQVGAILHQGKEARAALSDLMSRELKSEAEL